MKKMTEKTKLNLKSSKNKMMANLTTLKLETIRSEYRKRSISGKYPRQKLLPEYREIYPWILPDEKDPYYVFCTICECRLSAKRSDLGKHEGSLKHKENATMKDKNAKKSCKKVKFSNCIPSTPSTSSEAALSEVEEIEDTEPYIKQEPIIELIETSNPLSNLENSDGSDKDGQGEHDFENKTGLDSHSQHSNGIRDVIPMNVSTNETNNMASIREIGLNSSYHTTTIKQPTVSVPNKVLSCVSSGVQISPYNHIQQPSPCKITIKKISGPLLPSQPTQVTSTATITPVSAPAIRLNQQQSQLYSTPMTQQQQQQQQCLSTHSNLTPTITSAPCSPHMGAPMRDSFDTFFESVCASVKALPPKLATEGKMRVMQIVGELELRAITDREQELASTTSPPVSQQNATSTTK